jgi:hypothetical protein
VALRLNSSLGAASFNLVQFEMAKNDSTTQNNPNFLVIWGADIGITNLSCYSDRLMGYCTPNIDRIAKEGMRLIFSFICLSSLTHSHWEGL